MSGSIENQIACFSLCMSVDKSKMACARHQLWCQLIWVELKQHWYCSFKTLTQFSKYYASLKTILLSIITFENYVISMKILLTIENNNASHIGSVTHFLKLMFTLEYNTIS